MNEHARDPYVGLNQYFGRKAAQAVPSWYAVTTCKAGWNMLKNVAKKAILSKITS